MEIHAALDHAQAAILLLSADFLQSDFIRRVELPRLLDLHVSKGILVIPVVLFECLWKQIPELVRFQARPEMGRPLSRGNKDRREREFTKIAEEVLKLVQGSTGETSQSSLVTSDEGQTAGEDTSPFVQPEQSVLGAAAEMERLLAETAESVNRKFDEYTSKRGVLRELQVKLVKLQCQHRRSRDVAGGTQVDEQLKEIYDQEAAVFSDIMLKSLQADARIRETKRAIDALTTQLPPHGQVDVRP